MLLIAAFAIYAIIAKRVRITRTLTLTGRNARNYGITLLLILIPAGLLINLALGLILPEAVNADPIAGRLIRIVLLGAMLVLLAFGFRDAATAPAGTPPPPPSPPRSNTVT
jgi:hypothetical protein